MEVQIGGGVNEIEFPLLRLPPPVVFAVADAGRTNLRSGPGGEFTILRKLEFNERVEVIGRTRDQQWLLVVTTDGQEGWVSADVMSADQPIELVYEATPQATLTPTPLPDVRGTLVATANVRSRAQSDAPVVVELPAGAQVPVLARTRDGNWFLVRTESGAEGWLFGAVIELDQPADVVPFYEPTPIPSPTLNPSVTPPTATPPPPPTPTPRATNEPGIVPTPAPFNGFYFRDDAIFMDEHVVFIGGLLDIMKASGTNVEDCELFTWHYNLVKSSPTYRDVDADWRGMYGLYEMAQNEVLVKVAPVLDACQNLGEISDLNYSVARDAVNLAHDALVSAIQQAIDLLAAGPPGG